MASNLTTVQKIKNPNQPTPPKQGGSFDSPQPKMQGEGFASQQKNTKFVHPNSTRYDWSKGLTNSQNKTMNSALNQVAQRKGMNDLSQVNQTWNKGLKKQLIKNGVSEDKAKMMSRNFKKNALTKEQADFKNQLLSGKKIYTNPNVPNAPINRNLPSNRGIITAQQWQDYRNKVKEAYRPGSFQSGRSLYQLSKTPYGKTLGMNRPKMYEFAVNYIDPKTGETYITRKNRRNGEEQEYLYDSRNKTLGMRQGSLYHPIQSQRQ